MLSKLKTAFSVSRLIKSFAYALHGIWYVSKHERNMHVHWVAVIVVVGIGYGLHLSVTEWCLIALCIGSVLTAELFNSAIETLTNLVSPQYNEQAGKVKDIAAGAVLVAALAAVIVGLLIFLPKLYVLLLLPPRL